MKPEVITFINKDKKGAVAFGKKLKTINVEQNIPNFKFFLDTPYRGSPVYGSNVPYYVIVVGGDGTTITAFRHCWEKGILAYCVFIIVPFVDETKYHKNKGCCIGTISSMEKSEEEAISLLEGESRFYFRIMKSFIGCVRKCKNYSLDFNSSNGKRFSFLNEVVLKMDNYGKKCIFEIEINGQFLGEFKAEGILVTTQNGSTGWNSSLSQSSPILLRSAKDMFVINFIAPEYFVRPMVFFVRSEVKIRTKHNYPNDNLIICDGFLERVEKNEELRINFMEDFRFVRGSHFNSDEYLISKYNWFISKDKQCENSD